MVKEKSNGVSKGWRTAAIILGVLLLGMVAMLISGINMANVEAKCVNYCADQGYESFSYDYMSDRCDCYTGEDIIESVNIRR